MQFRFLTLSALFAGALANVVYSGFSTQCQQCLDSAVNQCNTGSQFAPCICDGQGMTKAMECVNACGTENPVQAGRLITVFSGYCCLKFPSVQACVQIVKAQGNSTSSSNSTAAATSSHATLTATSSKTSTSATTLTGTAARSGSSIAPSAASATSSAGAAATGDARAQAYGLSALLGLAVVAARAL